MSGLSAVDEGLRPSSAVPPATGADLHGWSALPLLGGATGPVGPWLFVMNRSLAWLSRGPLADADFVQTAAPFDRVWPFGDGALAGVVIDGDTLARGIPAASIDQVLVEASRVTGGYDNVLVVCGHRLVPRRLREWREYGRQTAREWRRAATRRGEDARTTAFLRLDDNRLTDVTVNPNDRAGEAGSPRESDRLVLRITGAEPGGTDVVQSMVSDASRLAGIGLRIDRIAVRKIGKTAVFLSGADGRRYIMRIARSPIARARAMRNFDTLEWLHGSSLPAAIVQCAPAPVLRGVQTGYEYFVETCLPGSPGPMPGRPQPHAARCLSEAAAYATTLHSGTARRLTLDVCAMDRLVREPIDRVTHACASLAAAAVLQRVAAECDAALGARALPLVRTHGDFTESNCLFGGDGRLTAVVDWELSEPAGLPLLDLLQLMPVEGEFRQHPRWQRFDAWVQLWCAPERVLSDPTMGPYARTLDLEPRTISALVLMQWATHVADRVAARRDDQRWMRLRVWQPLETLGRMLCD